MKRKGLIIALLGLAIMSFGVGFMLYGVSSETSSWGVGYGICGFGFLLVIYGLFIEYMAKKNAKSELKN